MKVLLVHNYYRYRGGEDRYVDILEKFLVQKNHQVIRFFCDSRSIERFSLFKRLSIPFRLIHSPELNTKLEKLLLKEKPDLAVVHNLSPLLSYSVLTLLKQKGIPILKRLENYKFLCLNGLFLRNNFKVCEDCKKGNFLHGVFHRCYQRSFVSSLGIALAEWLHRRRKTVINCTDLFLATSEFVKSKFTEVGFPAEKIEVRPNFIDFEPLESPAKPGSYAVYLGRLSREKGIVTLLKAFSDLPDVPLKILGEGPMEVELKEFVHEKRMKNVRFHGFIDGDAKKEILSGARFFIFSSECYESFGYTIAESLACGVPVIASGIGCARELITEGENGFLFEPGNAIDLREKVTRMKNLDDKQLTNMKETSLKIAKSRYTKEMGHQNLQELFQRVKGESKAANHSH